MNATLSSPSLSKTIDYVIDGLGRRVARKVNANSTAPGSIAMRCVPLPRPKPAAYSPTTPILPTIALPTGCRLGVPHRLIKDHLGSVRLVVNAQTGLVVQSSTTTSSGACSWTPSPDFAVWFRRRLYDPDTQLVLLERVTTTLEGGVGRRGSDRVRWCDANLYGYCGSDPSTVSIKPGANQPNSCERPGDGNDDSALGEKRLSRTCSRISLAEKASTFRTGMTGRAR